MSYLNLANRQLDVVVLGEAVDMPLVEDPATGGFRRSRGADAVSMQLLNLLSYHTGERLHRGDRGVDVRQKVFADAETTRLVVPIKLREAIDAFEPRVRGVTVVATGTGRVQAYDVGWVLRSSGSAGGTVYQPTGGDK